MKKKPTGLVLWKGKSLFDGERIMVIATGIFDKSKNVGYLLYKLIISIETNNK